MTLLFALLAPLVAIAVSPTAPWWALAAERVIGHVLEAFVTVTLPTLAILWQGSRTRRRIDEKRLESQSEHQRGLDEAQRRESVLAAKVEAAAQNLATKVESTTAAIQERIAENTSMTGEAAAASKEAASVANDVNAKIAATLSVVKKQQAQEQTRQERGE